MARTRSNLIHLDEERMARRGDKPMGGAETLDEVVYLLGAGMHPHLVAQQLGRSWPSIVKLAERYERASELQYGDIDEWRRYSSSPSGGRGRAA